MALLPCSRTSGGSCVATKIQASQTEHRVATKRKNGQRRNPVPSGLYTTNSSKVKSGNPINAAVPIEP